MIFLDLAISGHTESHKSMEISFERKNHIRIHKVVSKGNKIIKCDKHAAMATWYFSWIYDVEKVYKTKTHLKHYFSNVTKGPYNLHNRWWR